MDDRESRYEFGRTRWSLVLGAGKNDGDGAAAARNELLVRYHEAVYRYLLARLNDPHAAGELYSRFAERVLELHPFLERADPEKGRFRDYLRTVLRRMVLDYHRETQRANRRRRDILPGGDAEPVAPPDEPADDEATFRGIWVEELMNLAWQALAEAEAAGGQPYHSVLLYKAQNPATRSEAVAAHFTAATGRPFTAAGVRQLLHRGQEKLADLLVREVARGCADGAGRATADRVGEELIALGLFDGPRRDALERYRRG